MELPVLLVVDDYPDTDKVFKMWFRRRFVIISAESLQMAREVLHNVPVDGVVVDHYLPDGLGPSLLDDIPEGVPTVFMTGSVAALLQFGHLFDAAFEKPYDLQEVGDTIERLLTTI